MLRIRNSSTLIFTCRSEYFSNSIERSPSNATPRIAGKRNYIAMVSSPEKRVNLAQRSGTSKGCVYYFFQTRSFPFSQYSEKSYGASMNLIIIPVLESASQICCNYFQHSLYYPWCSLYSLEIEWPQSRWVMYTGLQDLWASQWLLSRTYCTGQYLSVKYRGIGRTEAFRMV
jgi:hypothetical protein